MKEFKGTPGPWVVDFNEIQARWNIDNSKGDSVALTSQISFDKDFSKRDANTMLIAAAPELLEALMAIVETRPPNSTSLEVVNARLAISKALGE